MWSMFRSLRIESIKFINIKKVKLIYRQNFRIILRNVEPSN